MVNVRLIAKQDKIRKYWENRSPGRRRSDKIIGSPEFFQEIDNDRYNNQFRYNFLKKIAEFDQHKGECILDIGAGYGGDIFQFAKNGANVYGIDLTANAIKYTKMRFRQAGLKGTFLRANFTSLPFKDNFFDIVYSYGVLHHSEETQQGIDEIFRVLKPGGKAIIMIYHKGFKYYIRKLFLHGILKGEYFKYSSQEIINKHSEEYGNSHLTKAYNRKEASRMFKRFEEITFSCYRLDDHFYIKNKPFSPARFFLPKKLYRQIENKYGWNLIIKARKGV